MQTENFYKIPTALFLDQHLTKEQLIKALLDFSSF